MLYLSNLPAECQFSKICELTPLPISASGFRYLNHRKALFCASSAELRSDVYWCLYNAQLVWSLGVSLAN